MTPAPGKEEAIMDGHARRQAALEMDVGTFQSLGHELVDQIAEFLDSLPKGPVTHDERPSVLREALDLASSLPEGGLSPAPY